MTVEISLSAEQEAFARSLVEQGRYSDIDQVFAQAIELLRLESEGGGVATTGLADVLADRRKGPFLSADELRSELDLRLARNRAGRGG
ncbi:MAG: type II toxin-antitoxin system ParD family antitoxin [Oceanicaulis sp.]